MLVLASSLQFIKPEAALSIYQAAIDVLQRFWPTNESALQLLDIQSDMANSLDALERHEEALRLTRTVYEGHLLAYGSAHQDTILVANNLTGSLIFNKLLAEAKTFARETLAAAQALEEKNEHRINAAARLAQILCIVATSRADTPEAATSRADLLEAEALIVDALKMRTRYFGPRHPDALRLADQLALARRDLARIS